VEAFVSEQLPVGGVQSWFKNGEHRNIKLILKFYQDFHSVAHLINSTMGLRYRILTPVGISPFDTDW
jgi:hypothetical protein